VGSATGVTFTIGRNAKLGPYVMHCHNIEHEDNDMMLRWGVLR
jgi:FtsP/CotA-like multicopper oxidase with cupredoxin domain